MSTLIFILALCATGTEYHWPIVRITNTTDFQWSRVDTVKAVYYEPEHTTVLGLDGRPRQYKAPFVVQQLGEVE
jgi:hypothetical protein